MRLGEGGPGNLTVKSGSTLTLGTFYWTGIGVTGDAILIVEAGALITIDVSNLPKGIYSVIARSKGQKTVKKIVVNERKLFD